MQTPSALPILALLVPMAFPGCTERKPDNHHGTTANERDGTLGTEHGPWDVLDDGLEIGRFALPKSPLPIGESTAVIVRVDPSKFALHILTAASEEHGNLSADNWAKRHRLSVVTNAGMFDTDHATHVGYMHTATGVNQKDVHPDYASVFAFQPEDPSLPFARIYDTDVTDFATEILPNFRGVVQNLRLIKRPGENRWSQQEKRWSEAALGEDASGNLLLIYCRTPYSMHDLNHHLLALPIDLVCAQHLEGGPEASLVVDHGGFRFHGMGSYETGFNENDDNREFWPIPNVIGFRKRVATP